MSGWLSRLFGGAAPAAPAAAPAVAPLPPASVTAAPAAPPADAPAFGARRPLLSAGGAIAGFEFELAPAGRSRWRINPDPVAQAAHAIALLTSMRSTVEAGRIALASLPPAVLARPAVSTQVMRGTMLALPGSAEVEMSDLITRLRSQGVRIGVPADQAGAPAGFDFIVLPLHEGRLDDLLETARECRAARPAITLVATGFDTIDDLEQALEAGITLVAGRVDAMRGAPDKQPLQAGVQRICQLLNRIGTDTDTALIAQEISTDVALSYRVLRYVNSPALGLSRGIESVEQAVMLLGRKELHRWLSVMLLSSAGGRKASRALQEISLSRARLLETLAKERGTEPPDALFTVGLLSLLDVMLQRPMAEALAPLKLGDAARQVLLERRGDWQDYLALATDLERHDLDAAAGRAQAFGGLERVLLHGEQAWRWAADVQSEMNS